MKNGMIVIILHETRSKCNNIYAQSSVTSRPYVSIYLYVQYMCTYVCNGVMYEIHLSQLGSYLIKILVPLHGQCRVYQTNVEETK